ncbi:hypothetical protein CAP40_11000 [Sphingomonas sp. IBVSS2]|uniref:ribosomal maturation YjgA family protein n=1 Tax=Sphingomonas sp. IBVSS2 TaxID=1985172 RepID=UPI000A2E691F|nr:DUF2809 domain-containing protein [Sphingomonas sp. IBVSS2]OSZ66408.1 hypothetical protein CAP40_11000 [Sphingomonas sp. IBVSS2]
MVWRPRHAIVAALLLVVEVLIALRVRDRFIRPYLGDVLAVILVHCALRAVLPIRALPAAATAFGIGALIELGQAIHILDLLGLRGIRVVAVVLGGSFEWLDFLAYAAGAGIALAVDRRVLDN